jgi:hypothetical protein
MISAIYLRERRREAQMRDSRETLALRFPMGLDPSAAGAGLSSLAGLAERSEIVVETIATAKGVAHALRLPAAIRNSALASLKAAMPGLRADEGAAPTGTTTAALSVFIPTPAVLRTDDPMVSARALLSGLVGLREGEQVVVRWAIRPGHSRPLPARQGERAAQVASAWRRKTSQPGFRVAGLVLVKAGGSARAREVIGHVASVLRSRRSDVGELRMTYDRGNRNLNSLPRVTRTSGWLSSAELLPLVAWPMGSELVPGVEVGAARELPVPRSVSGEGRQLLVGRSGSGDARPVALSAEAARHHMAVIGPSGVGKSVVLARGVLDDLAAGFGGALIDPKSDLVETILERVPDRHADRVVVLDPAASGPVVGLNVLTGGDPDLRADVLLGAFRSLFADSWGIRSDYYGRLALRTLGEIPGATLLDFGRLFFDAAFRRAALAKVSDPLLVGAWAGYEQLSPAEQAQHVQAPITKVMTLIERPAVRAVLAQPRSKLDVADLLAQRKWLLVSLAPGRLGEPAARLVGAIVMYMIWSAIEARVSLPVPQRRPVFVYVDEMASLATLPFSFESLAERARGLGAGLTVAAQTLGRLPEPVRAALLGNVATLITFRAGAEEATRLARELPGLSPLDIQSLGRFEVAARVGTGTGSAVALVTGRTLPPSPPTGQAAQIRKRSAEVYGVPDEAVPAGPATTEEQPLGRRRRAA